jgi:protein transport protein SEC61 subunit gamma-like protein
MDIFGKSNEIQRKLEERSKRIGKGKYGRVLKMAVKPDNDEYSKVIQIVGMGIILIGLLGFAIYYIWSFSAGWFMELLGLGI